MQRRLHVTSYRKGSNARIPAKPIVEGPFKQKKGKVAKLIRNATAHTTVFLISAIVGLTPSDAQKSIARKIGVDERVAEVNTRNSINFEIISLVGTLVLLPIIQGPIKGIMTSLVVMGTIFADILSREMILSMKQSKEATQSCGSVVVEIPWLVGKEIIDIWKQRS